MDQDTKISSPYTININDICRLCGDINTNLYSLFDDDLKEKIEKFIPIKVRKNNGFPSKICELCKSKLNTMYEFKSLAVVVDKKLHDILNKDHYLLKAKIPFEAESLLQVINKNDNIMMFNDELSNIQIIGNNDEKVKNKIQFHIMTLVSDDIEIDENKTKHNKTNLETKNSHVPQHEEDTLISNIDLPVMIGNNINFTTHKNIKSQENVIEEDIEMNQKSNLKMQDNVNKLRKQKAEQESENSIDMTLLSKWQAVAMANDIDSVKCYVCDKILKKANFSSHIKIHTKVYDKKCNICGALLLTKSQLWYHKKTKHREKKYVACDKCGKLFTNNSHFHVHYRTVHLKIKKFKCKICNASFGIKETLNRHMQTHTGERPHICHMCGRGLSSTNALKHHLRQHTNDTPYKCSDCGQSFKQKVTMQLHFKRQHLNITPEQERLAKLNESIE